ncbi:MAG: hypothetical protein RQ745_02680 [Longimicrobiales bacterium]|nr:hypothetical protein [Longimicrobiales bacterium]
MKLTRYVFHHCMGAFFEMATSDARRILPGHLQPMEARHDRSVMAVLAFQFTETEAGAYDELVLAVITPPLIEAGKPIPKAGFFPFLVATNTEKSRTHAMDRWRLPHYDGNVDFTWEDRGERMKLTVADAGEPVLELEVTSHEFSATVNPYHCFTVGESVGEDGRFKVNIFMDAPHSEHEFEEGALTLHEHPITSMLTIDEVASYPFREEWYRVGVQTFESLEAL